MYLVINGIGITLNPAWEYHEQYQHRANYPRNVEPKYMIMTPEIELYCETLEAAKRYLSDKRRVRGIKRRSAKHVIKNGIPF